MVLDLRPGTGAVCDRQLPARWGDHELIRRLLLLGAACTCGAAQAREARVQVISGATLIDGTERPAIENAVIVINGSRIAQVGRRGAIAIPPGATVIEGQGKYVIPGLADMHHHLMSGSLTPVPERRCVRNVRRPAKDSTKLAAIRCSGATDTPLCAVRCDVECDGADFHVSPYNVRSPTQSPSDRTP